MRIPIARRATRSWIPIGFALENFDLTGKWRTVDGKTPVDASGQLVDGTKLNGPATLRRHC